MPKTLYIVYFNFEGKFMAYVPVPKDLTKVKTKVALSLTKRQLLCFSAALLMELPLFFLLKDTAGTSATAFVMILVLLPCFLFAMYEKHGQPLETIVRHIIQTKCVWAAFLSPPTHQRRRKPRHLLPSRKAQRSP